jgi:hypothetical protein
MAIRHDAIGTGIGTGGEFALPHGDVVRLA